jgi:nicotinic acid phosphoribosyltransferase
MDEAGPSQSEIPPNKGAQPPTVLPSDIPLLVLADSYKMGHFTMYPPATSMTAYGEFRAPFTLTHTDGENKTVKSVVGDNRIVVYGIRYYIETIMRKVEQFNDVTSVEEFLKTHGVDANGNKKDYEFPKDLFNQAKEEKKGFPVKIHALKDGAVIYPHTPVFIIEAEKKYSHLCTFLETILTMIWYPSSVATLSRHCRTLIEEAFEVSTIKGRNHSLLSTRLHDFGFRGCTCIEQSIIGGSAHLLNFDGSDTMSACYYVQYALNNKKAIGISIPATEHSVMTSWETEIDAIKNFIRLHKGQTIACVMDSYDYDNALNKILPAIKEEIKKSGCTFVIRPDSGDPVQQVIKALKAAKEHGFESTVENEYIVFTNVAVIQGDGIDYFTIKKILHEVLKEKFSAVNVAFGMGGGLLQKVNRDTMSFATKLCHINYEQDDYKKKLEYLRNTTLTTVPSERDIMKKPATDIDKYSLPGKLRVLRQLHIIPDGKKYGPHQVFPDEICAKLVESGQFEESMDLVYENGISQAKWEDFETIRKRVNTEWNVAASDLKGDGRSFFIKEKQLITGERISKTLKDLGVSTHNQNPAHTHISKSANSSSSEKEFGDGGDFYERGENYINQMNELIAKLKRY